MKHNRFFILISVLMLTMFACWLTDLYSEDPRVDIKFSGIIFTDENGNGVFEENEPGLESAVVTMVNKEGEILWTTETDSNGRFEITVYNAAGASSIIFVPPVGYELLEDSKIKAGQIDIGESALSGIEVAMVETDLGLGQVTPLLQPIVLEGAVFSDPNVNGIQDEDEPAIENLEVLLMDLDCTIGCEPVAYGKTDVDGYFLIEFESKEGSSFTIDFDINGWSAMRQNVKPDVLIVNALPPMVGTAEYRSIPIIPWEFKFPDPLGDTVDTETDEQVVNPAGDIEWVVVGVNPDGSLRIEVKPATDEGKDAYSMGIFVNEMRSESELNLVWHLWQGVIDAGQMDGWTGERPNILSYDDLAVELGDRSWVFSGYQIMPKLLVLGQLGPIQVRVFNIQWEVDSMTFDSLVIPIDQLEYVGWWGNYLFDR